MANVAAEGPLWTFTTSGTPPADPPPPPPDTTAPVVVVYAPANGATVSGTRQVSAATSDNGPVAGVQFTLDGVNLGAEDRSAPFTLSWDTRTAANRTYVLAARARDVAGNIATSAPVSVTVSNPTPPGPDTIPPVVSLSSPTGGSTVADTITLSATASDNVGIAGVQFKLDGVNVGAEDTTAPYSVSWDTRTAANGTYVLAAQARDAAGNVGNSAAVSVTVSNGTPPGPDTIPPVVALSSPSGGSTVADTITLSATASDNVGIAGVQFKLDGVNLGA